MHKELLVASIKVGNKIMPERNGSFYIPFGSEYSIYLKNLDVSKNVCVSIDIDGKSVTGDGLVVRAGQTIDLERYITPNNLSKGNRFKFIERTGKIEAARGVKADDGVVSIKFEYEKQIPIQHYIKGAHTLRSRGIADTTNSNEMYRGVSGTAYDSNYLPPSGTINCSASYNDAYGGSLSVSGSASDTTHFINASGATLSNVQNYINTIPNKVDVNVNTAGITTHGSESNQKFHEVSFEGNGIIHQMSFQLLGSDNIELEKPVKVIKNTQCTLCKTVNEEKAKFCNECGTNLTIY